MEIYGPQLETHDEMWRRVRREQDALEARYAAINQRWKDSGIPYDVYKTPGYKLIWACYLAWCGKYDVRAQNREQWDKDVAASWPHNGADWVREIHIMSHMYCPGGHGPAHVALEEEGQRVILDLWQQQRAAP